jgi:hypothetical protein
VERCRDIASEATGEGELDDGVCSPSRSIDCGGNCVGLKPKQRLIGLYRCKDEGL